MSHDSQVSTVEPLADCPLEIGFSQWTVQEVATLLYHIAVFEVDWLYVDILGGDHDMDRRIPNSPPQIAAVLPYPMMMGDWSYTPVESESLATHLERLSLIREAFLEVVGGMSLTDFRTLRPSDDDMVTPEWVVEHLSQHEAEHRGQIWEARVTAEARAASQST